MLAIGGTVGAVFFGIMSAMKNNEPYKESLQLVSRHPLVIDALGDPIRPGFMVIGNINLEGDQTAVNISYTIKGDVDSGRVYVQATQVEGEWKYDLIGVTVAEDGDKLNLTQDYYQMKGYTSSTDPQTDGPSEEVAITGEVSLVKLKNGREVEGIVRGRSEKGIQLEMEDLGVIIFSWNEIESIS